MTGIISNKSDWHCDTRRALGQVGGPESITIPSKSTSMNCEEQRR
jgi:hypothetical protein